MAIRVRYHPNELTDHAEYEVFKEATHYMVYENNTLELRKRTSNRTFKRVGVVHASRWDSCVVLMESEEQEQETE